eukprot:s1356_g4.t1
MQEVQDLVNEEELPPADPTGSDLSVLSQKRLNAELKPAAAKKAKAKPKPVAKQRANPNPGPNFKVKKHKRKGSGELADWWYTAAIHDSTKNKQVAQLSCGVTDDYLRIVTNFVDQLNKGEKTTEEVIAELNAIKGL